LKHDTKKPRKNYEITATTVRVIGSDGQQIGIQPLRVAQQMAQDIGLDLIEITPNANPPVVKIADYGKMMFDQQKRQRQAEKNQTRTETREIQLRPVTDENDYQVKIKKAIEFLQDQDRVRVVIKYFGREIVHQDLGEKMLQRVITDLAAYGTPDKGSVLERKNLTTTFVPVRKK
jgi:translation initiation factor IF-3